ncbi:MAG TPA: hypothetical protein VFL99_04075 [Segeticoccus sp.]|uniref:hypothetical protein n=1 Tax=Segeticoccus sp. TaxID=2706531 RepID=UPI002D80EB05|nr:hypothetical protein [Segeticoccus sp.]HET8599480.1 hypothetical protein [Segeticoccus sp.]
MDLQQFLDLVGRGTVVEGGSEAHLFMHRTAQESLQVVAELNTGYGSPSGTGRSSGTAAS